MKKRHFVTLLSKLFWTAVIVGPLFYFGKGNQLQMGYSVALVLILIAVWYITPADFKNMVVDLREGKLEINKLQRETKQAAQEVLVTADRFDKVVDSFTEFSLDSLQTQGRLGAAVPWQSAANFVVQARKMSRTSPGNSETLAPRVAQSQQKVISLFRDNLVNKYPEAAEEVKSAIGTTDFVENGEIKYMPGKGIVDLQALHDIEPLIEADKLKNWRQDITDFKKFYKQVEEDV